MPSEDFFLFGERDFQNESSAILIDNQTIRISSVRFDEVRRIVNQHHTNFAERQEINADNSNGAKLPKKLHEW